jgi:hypothetical protein
VTVCVVVVVDVVLGSGTPAFRCLANQKLDCCVISVPSTLSIVMSSVRIDSSSGFGRNIRATSATVKRNQ